MPDVLPLPCQRVAELSANALSVSGVRSVHVNIFVDIVRSPCALTALDLVHSLLWLLFCGEFAPVSSVPHTCLRVCCAHIYA